MSAGRKSITTKKDWCTPPKYIELINNFFDNKIDLDPCSNSYSLVNATTKFSLPHQNGLLLDWNPYKNIYINPPYGRDALTKTSIYDWIEKACNLNLNSSFHDILLLIPVATNTKHFKQLIFKYANGICFLYDTRLKFYNEGKEDKKGAPMACCMIYIGNNFDKFNEIFKNVGKIFKIS